MAETIEEICIDYMEDGIAIVKQLDKEVLTKGAWSTIVFRYQEWNRKEEAYGKEKYGIRRYQKRNGEYVQKSKFAISSADQARKFINILQKWLPEEE